MHIYTNNYRRIPDKVRICYQHLWHKFTKGVLKIERFPHLYTLRKDLLAHSEIVADSLKSCGSHCTTGWEWRLSMPTGRMSALTSLFDREIGKVVLVKDYLQLIEITIGALLLKRGVAEGTWILGAAGGFTAVPVLRLPVRERGVW